MSGMERANASVAGQGVPGLMAGAAGAFGAQAMAQSHKLRAVRLEPSLFDLVYIIFQNFYPSDRSDALPALVSHADVAALCGFCLCCESKRNTMSEVI
jgi:hypothetical protein